MSYRKYFFVIAFLITFFSLTSPSFAAFSITPLTTPTNTKQTFIVTVSSENQATIGITLQIPNGLSRIIPKVKPGWNISLTKNANGSSEIDWLYGVIPQGQEDDFSFTAQLPTNPMILVWNGTQTFADGTITSWNQKLDKNNSLVTKVITSVTPEKMATEKEVKQLGQQTTMAFILGIVAFITACVALSFARRYNRSNVNEIEKPLRKKRSLARKNS